MDLPVEPQTSETLAHAVESLRRAGRPMTGREILKAIPPPSRVDVGALEQLLTGTRASFRGRREPVQGGPGIGSTGPKTSSIPCLWICLRTRC